MGMRVTPLWPAHGGQRDTVIGCKLKQNANEGRNSCASLAGLVLCFIACFILLVIAPYALYDDWMACVDSDWYGYIANVSVRTTAQLSFEFVYPADRCCQNVLFYIDEQVASMGPRTSCWQREYVLRPEDDQILRLTPSFSWSGCHVVGSDSPDVGDLFVCKGGRSFSVYADRLTTWYIAVSNCATMTGIELRYRLEVCSTSCSVTGVFRGGALRLPLLEMNFFLLIFNVKKLC